MRSPWGARVGVVCSTLIVLAACGGEETGSLDTEVTLSDSAGVEILMVPASVLEELPTRRLMAEPSLVIGRLDGPDEEMFGRVTDATLLQDGSVVVADHQQTQLLVFDDRGSFSRRIGSLGDGPGEFRSLQSVSSSNDTLYVHSNGLVSRFLSDGTFLDARPAFVSVGIQMGIEFLKPAGWRVPTLYWTLRNAYPRDVPEGDGPYDILFHFAVADTSGGRLLATLDATPGYWLSLTSEQVALARDEGLQGFTTGNVVHHPLTPDVQAAYVREGPVVGRSGASSLDFLDWTGDVRRTARYDLPVGFDVQDESLLEWLVSLDAPGSGPMVRRAWEGLSPPEIPASFFDLRVGNQNGVWIATRPEPTGQLVPWTRWLRVDSGGMPVEWVLTPGADILDVGPQAVLVRTTDDLGVHRVARHDFR